MTRGQEVKMRYGQGYVLFMAVLLLACASLEKSLIESSYTPEPDKFSIYKISVWNDGLSVHGQIMADNLSAHDLGGFVKCDWFNRSNDLVSHETQGFELKSGAKKLLEYSALASGGGRERMHLTCDIIYLVCHDCGERVIVNK